MKRKFQIWDRKEILYPQAGEPYTPERVFAEWGWTQNPNAVVLVEIYGGAFVSIDNLGVLKQMYGIETEDIDKAISEIEEIVNTPTPQPTDEESPMTRADAQMLGQILTDIQLSNLNSI